MAKLTKLITYAYLKEEVDLPQNIENNELDHKIYKAQETLRMLMRDEFYQDYITQFHAGLTGAYATLFPYVKQYLAWQTYEYYVIMANFKPTRSGFRVHTEPNSEAVSDINMATIIKDAKQHAQMYKNLMVDYLNGHSSDFTLYSKHCHSNLTGNSFHISAVKNRTRHKPNCNCGCHS